MIQSCLKCISPAPRWYEVRSSRGGWDLNIDFALANPALYTLMYGNPHRAAPHPAVAELWEVLLGLVRRVAEAGRLCVSVERRVIDGVLLPALRVKTFVLFCVSMLQLLTLSGELLMLLSHNTRFCHVVLLAIV